MTQANFEPREDVITELGFQKSQIPRIASYLNHLLEWNQDLNLMSRQMTPQDIVDNHIVDCLLPLKYFPPSVKRVADFGSGGGLPVVLFALQFPEIQFTAFEKSARKRQFLQSCVDHFVPNLTVEADIPLKLIDIDLVTARAFKPIDVIFSMSRDYFERGGPYFLLKGRREKIQEELALAKKKFSSVDAEILPLKSPLLDVERHLVKLRKAK